MSKRIENGCTSKLILKNFPDRQTDLRERRKDALAVKCSKMHIASLSLSAVVATMTAHLVAISPLQIGLSSETKYNCLASIFYFLQVSLYYVFTMTKFLATAVSSTF